MASLHKSWERKEKKMEDSNSCTRAEKAKPQAEYIEANRQTKKSIRADTHDDNWATEAEQAARKINMNEQNDNTKKLAGKSCKAELTVKEKEGKPIMEDEQQRNRWIKHAEEPLNRPPHQLEKKSEKQTIFQQRP